jgi:hypothetical protein
MANCRERATVSKVNIEALEVKISVLYNENAHLQLKLEEMTQLLKDYRDCLKIAHDYMASPALQVVEEELEKRGEALGAWKRCGDCQLLECICDEKVSNNDAR